MSLTQHSRIITRDRTLEALWALSGFPEGLDADWLSGLIGKAPDPETAHQVIMGQIPTESEALRRKWRKIISQTWLEQHPNVPAHLDMAVTSTDVIHTRAYMDACTILEAIKDQPVRATRKNGKLALGISDVRRILRLLARDASSDSLYRTLEVFNDLRLMRLYKGELRVVQTRCSRFRSLPYPVQFYLLWHADMYHVPWSTFSDTWEQYVDVIQQYIPLVWEMSAEREQGDVDRVHEFTHLLLGAYYPLWQQEQVLDHGDHFGFLSMYEQSALCSIIETVVIHGALGRYGLISAAGSPHEFAWTPLGIAMLEAERTKDLPCASDILQ